MKLTAMVERVETTARVFVQEWVWRQTASQRDTCTDSEPRTQHELVALKLVF
jgi:hypothetical protein